LRVRAGAEEKCDSEGEQPSLRTRSSTV
jgi:hypothetical protein